MDKCRKLGKSLNFFQEYQFEVKYYLFAFTEEKENRNLFPKFSFQYYFLSLLFCPSRLFSQWGWLNWSSKKKSNANFSFGKRGRRVKFAVFSFFQNKLFAISQFGCMNKRFTANKSQRLRLLSRLAFGNVGTSMCKWYKCAIVKTPHVIT